MTELTV